MQKSYMLAVGQLFARQDSTVLQMLRSRAQLAILVGGAWRPRIHAMNVSTASLDFMSLSGVPLIHLVFALRVRQELSVMGVILNYVLRARVIRGADEGQLTAYPV